MITWTYNIIADTIPEGIDKAALASCIRKAMERVKSAAGGQVTFVEAPWSLLLAPEHRRFNVTIGFEQLAGARQSGSKLTIAYPDGTQVHSIAFDVRWKWAVSWWQRLFLHASGRQCLLTVAMHELGHLLGLGHSDDPWSVMHTPPFHPQFSEFDRMELLYLTREK